MLQACEGDDRWLFQAGLRVISAPELGHFGQTH